MPKKIDHEKRKEKILQTALKVFAREGYKDANLSLIASECGISRPTIYQYIKKKDQIYYYAVKLVTGRTNICSDINDMAATHRGELTSLVDVMLQLKKEGTDFSDIILRRTVKLHILFKRLLRLGINSGEIVKCDINKITYHIVMLLESFGFQLAFLDAFDVDEAKDLMANYLELLNPVQ